MNISKSLFVDYKDFPKLAWWKQNDVLTYKSIMGIDDESVGEQMIELGQSVENLVGEYFLKKYGLIKLDVFKDNLAKNPLDEEDEDIYLLAEDYKTKRDRNLTQTIESIRNKEPLIYQPGFMIDGLFVRGDYLKLNQNGNYDLIEVKAKTSVRKDKTFQKVRNKNIGNLQENFLYDISFQKYVANKVLQANKLPEIENFYYAYLNYKYKKDGEVDVSKIVVMDQVNIEKDIVLQGETSNKDEKIEDYLLTDGVIELIIQKMREELVLSKEEFNKIHPFSGSRFIEYFGEDRIFGTIFGKGLTSPAAVRELYYEGKTQIDDLAQGDKEKFNTSTGSVGSARKYIENYLQAKKDGDYIDSDGIKGEFDDIRFPICFYDYETCSVPIPFLDCTSPYQQVVVQYSLHKVYKDGRIEHFGGLLEKIGEKSVRTVEIPDNGNKVDFESEKVITGCYEDLLNEFIIDIGEDLDKTFIVWYKPFENTRNKETAETFPALAQTFETINENTYDLMDIFKKGFYYSLDFQGSNSIKYVLPAMVPNMSYDGMNIPNGGEAMQVLNKIINTESYSDDEREEQIKNLLLYCGQDTLAMYKIYEKVLLNLN